MNSSTSSNNAMVPMLPRSCRDVTGYHPTQKNTETHTYSHTQTYTTHSHTQHTQMMGGGRSVIWSPRWVLDESGGSMERVWPPRPRGGEGGECGERLASISRGQEHIFHREPSSFSSRFSYKPIACYQIMFSFLYMHMFISL